MKDGGLEQEDTCNTVRKRERDREIEKERERDMRGRRHKDRE